MTPAYVRTVATLIDVAPAVFANDVFAMKGGTALNLFLHDMPRLSVDIDVVFLPASLKRSGACNPNKGPGPLGWRSQEANPRGVAA